MSVIKPKTTEAKITQMSKPDGLYEKHYGNGEVEKINYKTEKKRVFMNPIIKMVS